MAFVTAAEGAEGARTAGSLRFWLEGRGWGGGGNCLLRVGEVGGTLLGEMARRLWGVSVLRTAVGVR